jgi:hypothetical protein
MLDRDPGSVLPGEDSLLAWLERASSRVGSGGDGQVQGPSWIEAGLTIETLVADGGLEASRSRRRVWAMALLRRFHPAPGRERPKILVGRTLKNLPVNGWTASIGSGRRGGARVEKPRTGDLVVTGDASAGLVAALTQAAHGSPRTGGAEVGRGWCLRDDPLFVGGMSGGIFDDAGFATRCRALANGSRVVGVLGTRGHYLRPSFRDVPTPGFATLVVAEKDDRMPAKGFLADGLRVHRLEADRWVLDLEGVWLGDGRPSLDADRLEVTVRPLELVVRCTGSVGRAQQFWNGVVAPALIFEGIRLR